MRFLSTNRKTLFSNRSVSNRGLVVAGVFVSLLVAANVASAQSVIGKSAIDGRVVELLSDNTWRYTDNESPSGGCKSLILNVAFCGKKAGWTEVDAPNPEIAAQYHYNDRHYGQYVIEGIGSDDGLNTAFFRKVVISNAADVAGISEKDVIILSIEDGQLEGRAMETIIYQLAIDGLEVVFVNTIVVLPKRSIQAITFSIGKTLTDKHSELHQQFLDYTRIN